MAAEAQKFLFEARFDADAQAAREGAEGRAAREREVAEERDTLREAAFEEGRRAGRAEAEESVAQATAKALANVGRGLERLHAQGREMQAEMTASAAKVAFMLVGKFLPALTRRHALGEIEGLIEATLRQLLTEPRVVVRVHDSKLDALRKHIDDIARGCGFAGDVVLLAEPGLAPENCRVEWADGGVERDVDRLWQDIERAAARFLPPAQREAAADGCGAAAGRAAPPEGVNQPPTTA